MGTKTEQINESGQIAEELKKSCENCTANDCGRTGAGKGLIDFSTLLKIIKKCKKYTICKHYIKHPRTPGIVVLGIPKTKIQVFYYVETKSYKIKMDNRYCWKRAKIIYDLMKRKHASRLSRESPCR